MPGPIVSVVIPTHNRAHYLFEALESVFAQSFQNLEIIVVDDGSTDGTREQLKPLAAANKLRYQYQQKQGVSAARNLGVELAQGAYIAFLDSDDLFQPPKLEKQLALFESDPELGFVHSNFSKFNDRGEDLGYRNTARYQGWIYPWMLGEWSVLMAPSCMLARREVLLDVGGFDETISLGEDIDLWRRIAMRYRIGVVPEALSKVRVHPGNASKSKQRAAEEFRRVLDKAFLEDSDLTTAFRRRAYAKMHTNVGQNVLGEGNRESMGFVRRQSLRALSFWPLELNALLALLASFLPLGLRTWLVQRIRGLRYPALPTERL